MGTDDRIPKVQRLYPLLYFACHRSHDRRDGLTERDLRLLHHIGAEPGVFGSALGRHLGLSRSTISEALKRLESDGLIVREPAESGRKSIHLTDRGAKAITSDDGLDGAAIGSILDRLDEEEQRRVVDGLELLARAISEGER